MTDQPKLPWWRVAPESGDPEQFALRFAAQAIAHWHAHDAAMDAWMDADRHSQPVINALRASVHGHLYPFTAAFAAAALAKGWTTRGVQEALTDGQTAVEFLWDWLAEAGVDADSIAPANDQLTTQVGVPRPQAAAGRPGPS